METLIKDIRFGLRILVKNPAFTAIAILTLGLGIGANTAIFNIVNGVLLKPLPYPKPERLMRVFESSKNFPKFPLSPGGFLDFRDKNKVFENLAIYTREDLEMSLDDRPERLAAMRVSAGFFQLLGFQLLLGRDFLRDDELDGKSNVAILGYNLWQRRFGGDANIIGKAVTFSGKPYTIVGVLPPGVQHVGGDYRSLPHGETVDVWWVMGLKPTLRGSHFLNAVGRLKPGVTKDQAQEDLNTIAARLAEQYPNTDANWSIRVNPLHDELVGGTKRTLWILLGAVAFVLLIACVNVANLMLARAAAREREMAVRSALGAGRARLARQLLTESLLIAVMGGALGWLFAVFSLDVLISFGPTQIPRLQMLAVDYRMVIFTSFITLLTGVLFGIAPAWQTSRANLNEVLKEGSHSASGSGQPRRLRGSLVVAQVSLALVLLIGAGLLLRSFIKLQQTNPGFNPEGVLTMHFDLPRARYDKPERIKRFYEELLERVRTLPGVRSAGASSDIPWTGYDENLSFTAEGHTYAEDQEPKARYHFVTPDYFPTIGVPLLAGRDFKSTDTVQSPAVILINQTAARRYWPEADSLDNIIGKRITFNDTPKEEDWLTVVGIVGDVKDTPVSAEAEPALYWPHAQQPFGEMILALQADKDPRGLIDTVRREVQSLDKDLPVADVKTLATVADAAVEGQRFTLLLVCLFATVALLLAAVGIYGLMAFSVTQRTHEIGVRVALGAKTSDIMRIILKEGMRLTSLGVAAGLVSAFALTRLMATLLYGVSATDIPTFSIVTLFLAGVALVACFVPARRAAKTDPMIALRYE